MRSRPYTPPPPLPPIFDDLASMLPRPKAAYHPNSSTGDIPLDNLDPETSQLIPTKKRTHRVWVQGKLAAVRSVSIAARSKSRSRADRGIVGDRVQRRRRSVDDVRNLDDEEEKETAIRARQLRGYGIGGVGNIRRPTDVIHGSHPASPQTEDAPAGSAPTSPMEATATDRKWNLREMLSLTADDPKGKSRASR